MKRFLLFAAGAVLCVFLGEIFARYGLGLGDPVLYVAHPTIEYMQKPNQDLWRFHNHMVSNQYGMRSPPFGVKKSGHELRVMVFGDSVVNGGALTDQRDLATSRLESALRERGYPDAIVGNISAGSWGPGNWLAYVQEYGFFDCDVAVLVISSHDDNDNPTFEPLDHRTHPTEKPFFALWEAFDRYVSPRLFEKLKNASAMHEKTSQAASNTKGLDDLKRFLTLARQQGAVVLVFQHLEKPEIVQNVLLPGHERIEKACKELGVPVYQLGPSFRRDLDKGVDPYRDVIHPNVEGQKILTEVILPEILRHIPSAP